LDDAKRVSRDLTIVNEVLLVLGRNLGTEDLLLKIAQRTVERLSCQRCTIFVPDRECGEVVLTPRAALGWTGTPTRRFKLGEGLAGWAFSRGEPIMLGNPYDDPRFAPARSENTPPRSTLVVPVTVGGQSIGVICADHNEFDWFSDDDCSLVEILGQQLGIAIQRSITLTLLQDIGNRIASSQKVDDILREVISGAVRLTNTTSGSIYLLSDDGRKVLSSYQMADFRHPLPRLESPHGMTRMILETGRVLCVGDIVADPRVNPALRQVFRSMMGVPLKCDGKVVGVFYLNDVMPHDFSEAELSLVMLLATQAVIAIQMARSLQPPSYSCFLSYSSRDQAFATRLHADLRNDGVLCWFAPKDVRAGKKLHVQIDEAIRGSDRLLLILSEDSMNSEWVRTEISHARQKEVDEHRQVLFPISLVPFDKIGDWKCFDADIGKDSAREIREYFIPDFSNWLDSESYCHAYAKLVRDLKAERPKSDG
jgi:GAF domain-containing protein